MKPLLILILSLFFTLTTIGQQPEYPDSGFTKKTEAKNLTVNGLQEGKWIYYYFTDIDWTHITTDTNRATNYCLTIYKNGIPNGIQRKYYMRGELQEKAYYMNGTLNGFDVTYYVNGRVKSEAHYTNGIENGIERIYYENGITEFEINYIDGKRSGIAKMYRENGHLYTEAFYKNGIAGPTKYYDDSGKETPRTDNDIIDFR